MPTTDYYITDGNHTPAVYVQSVTEVPAAYTSTTVLANAKFYSTQAAATSEANWLNTNFGERFGVHSHPH